MIQMFDKLTNSGIMQTFSKGATYMAYIQALLTDCALYVFGIFLMDSLLQTAYKNESAWALIETFLKPIKTFIQGSP